MHRRTGGACSASGGEAVCSGVTHRLGCVEARMGLDPRDCQVMMPADSGEKAPDSLNEGLVAARFYEVVPEEADAVLTVGKEVNAPPGHSRGGPVPAANRVESGEIALISPVLFVGRGAPIHSKSVQSVMTGPQTEAEES